MRSVGQSTAMKELGWKLAPPRVLERLQLATTGLLQRPVLECSPCVRACFRWCTSLCWNIRVHVATAHSQCAKRTAAFHVRRCVEPEMRRG